MAHERPNVLVIHTDQQSCWTLGCYGGTAVETPNIDRLASEGAMFANFFTNSAVCTPSRGCLVTGRYPHCHGAYINNIPLNRDEITFAQVLKDHGYATGYAGKWHLDGTPRPGWVHPERTMGFDHSEFMFNRGHWKRIDELGGSQPMHYPYEVIGDERSYTTDWLTDKTICFLEEFGGGPFCFMLSIPDPHSPAWVRPPYDRMYDPAAMAIPYTFDHGDLPDWAQALQKDYRFGRGKPNRERDLRQFLAWYCGEIKLIDDSVGRITAALKRLGILDETIVIFTSDHGEYAGEHGLEGKNHLYETAYAVPLLMRWPGGIAPGNRIEHIVSTVDFQPTLLALMGVPPCGREQGRDGSAFLADGETEWEEAAFLHHDSHECAGLFTPQYELALVKGHDSILFDRVSDPEQSRNLFDDPSYRDVIDTLVHRIAAHHAEFDSPARIWIEPLAK